MKQVGCLLHLKSTSRNSQRSKTDSNEIKVRKGLEVDYIEESGKRDPAAVSKKDWDFLLSPCTSFAGGVDVERPGLRRTRKVPPRDGGSTWKIQKRALESETLTFSRADASRSPRGQHSGNSR